MKDKAKYILENWKVAIHFIFRTKRFGVNNERWGDFDSIFGVPTIQIIWDTVRIYPLIRNYKQMKIRALMIKSLTPATFKILGWK